MSVHIAHISYHIRTHFLCPSYGVKDGQLLVWEGSPATWTSEPWSGEPHMRIAVQHPVRADTRGGHAGGARAIARLGGKALAEAVVRGTGHAFHLASTHAVGDADVEPM